MERKEYYKQNLPHFQQPGQAYFVTWNLKDAVPAKALKRYTQQLKILKSQINTGVADSDLPINKDADRNRHHPEFATPEIEKLRIKYYSPRKKHIKAYYDLLDAERNPKIDVSKPEYLKAAMLKIGINGQVDGVLYETGAADSDPPFSPGAADSDPPLTKDADRNRHHPIKIERHPFPFLIVFNLLKTSR